MSEQPQEWTPLSLAQHFHNLYERAAPDFGYETRTETRAFNPESSNGKLMIAVCSEILRDFNAALAAEQDSWDISPKIRKLRQELAAEQEKRERLRDDLEFAKQQCDDAWEKVKLLVDALEEMAQSVPLHPRVLAALAKVKPYPLPDGRTK